MKQLRTFIFAVVIATLLLSACAPTNAGLPAWDEITNPPEVGGNFRGNNVYEVEDVGGQIWGSFIGSQRAEISYTVLGNKTLLRREFLGVMAISDDTLKYADYFIKGTGASTSEVFLAVENSRVFLYMPDFGPAFDEWIVWETPTMDVIQKLFRSMEDLYVELCFTWHICWDDPMEIGSRQVVIDPKSLAMKVVDYEFVLDNPQIGSGHLVDRETYRKWLHPRFVENFTVLARDARIEPFQDPDSKPPQAAASAVAIGDRPNFKVGDDLGKGMKVLEPADGSWAVYAVDAETGHKYFYNPNLDKLGIKLETNSRYYQDSALYLRIQFEFAGLDPNLIQIQKIGKNEVITFPALGEDIRVLRDSGAITADEYYRRLWLARDWGVRLHAEKNLLVGADKVPARIIYSESLPTKVLFLDMDGSRLVDPNPEIKQPKSIVAKWIEEFYVLDEYEKYGKAVTPPKYILEESSSPAVNAVENTMPESVATVAPVLAPEAAANSVISATDGTIPVQVIGYDGKAKVIYLTEEQYPLLKTPQAADLLAAKNVPMAPKAWYVTPLSFLGKTFVFSLEVLGVYITIQQIFDAAKLGKEIPLSGKPMPLDNFTPAGAANLQSITEQHFWSNSPLLSTYEISNEDFTAIMKQRVGECGLISLDDEARWEVVGDYDVTTPIAACPVDNGYTLTNLVDGSNVMVTENPNGTWNITGTTVMNFESAIYSGSGNFYVSPIRAWVDANGLHIMPTWQEIP